MSQRGGCASCATFALAMLAASAPSLSAADGSVADPKVWCGQAARTVMDKDTEKFIDSVVSAGEGLTDRPSVAKAFASLASFLAAGGKALSPSFLFEKTYAETFSRVWFLLQFENGFLFLRCDMAKRGGGWILKSIVYNSEPDKVGLP